MANLTLADVADRSLEILGVKPLSQASTATDAARAREKLTSIHSMLRKEGLVNFASSAIPDWAQDALAHMTADKLLPLYGVGPERAQLIKIAAVEGRRDLAAQMHAKKQPTRARVKFY